jgi:hypothetical protein
MARIRDIFLDERSLVLAYAFHLSPLVTAEARAELTLISKVTVNQNHVQSRQREIRNEGMVWYGKV